MCPAPALEFRVRDKHPKRLNEMSRSSNAVANDRGASSERASREPRLCLSGHACTTGAAKDPSRTGNANGTQAERRPTL